MLWGLSKPFKNWPDWAKACAKMELATRRQDAEISQREISFSDLGIDSTEFDQTPDGTGSIENIL